MQDSDTAHKKWCELMGQTSEVIRTRCEAAKRVGRSGALGCLGADGTEAKREALRVGQAWVDALAAEVKLEEDLDALEAQMHQARGER